MRSEASLSFSTQSPGQASGSAAADGEHPSYRAVRLRGPRPAPAPLTATHLRALALEAGADDAGCVALDLPELDGERPYILAAMADARTLVSFVVRLH